MKQSCLIKIFFDTTSKTDSFYNPVIWLFITPYNKKTQTVSKIPQGIFSSCANLFAFQTKDARDRDMILPHLGKSEKGMVNTEYKRYLARIPKTYAIVKLGYSADVYDIEPVLIQPAFIQCVEPSDEDILRVLRVGEVG